MKSKPIENTGRRGKNNHGKAVRLETRVFELCYLKYANLSEMAQAMGISVSQIYRVRKKKRPISEKFIIGTVKAFPGCKLDDLFYVVGSRNNEQH